MRIGFDVRPVFRKNSRNRGIGTFTRQQLHALLETGGHEFVLYSLGGRREALSRQAQWKDLPEIRRPSRLNWLLDRFRLGAWIQADGLQAYHATEVTAMPGRTRTPVVATVHDVIPLVFWDRIKPSLPLDYRVGLRDSYRRVKRAQRIVTISHSAKQDICAYLEIEPEKVDVCYPGCDRLFRPIDRDIALKTLQQRYGIEPPFVFYVGGSDFRKNLELLVRGFARLRDLGAREQLVLGGETFQWRIPEVERLRRLSSQLGVETALRTPGYIRSEDLPAFYSLCEFFVFPSLYEGFGLPVLEALRCGAAVLTSDASSLPEVGGDAVEYFDADRVESLVAAWDRLCGDRQRLRQLRESARRQSLGFQWTTHASQLVQIYDSMK